MGGASEPITSSGSTETAAAAGSPPIRGSASAASKSAGYCIDFDDPNFNPFATKSKVCNDSQVVVDEPPPLEVVEPAGGVAQRASGERINVVLYLCL
jgi:hypothetical protein